MTEPHKIKYTHVAGNETREPFHHGRCLGCGETSGGQRTKQMVEDWANKHQDKMERLRLKIHGRPLTDQGALDHFRKMAEVADNDTDRFQWKQLADELDRRIHGEDKRYSTDVPLEFG